MIASLSSKPIRNKRRAFIALFILGVPLANAFAGKLDSEIKGIEKLEKIEEAAPAGPIARPGIAYKTKDLRSPFAKPFVEQSETAVEAAKPEAAQAPEKHLPALTVQGVIWGGIFPQAIINNKVVRIGDTIEKVGITGINKDGIEVIFEERIYQVPSPAVIKPSTQPQGG